MNKQMLNQRDQHGFTLIELIIVVVILSVAAFLAIPMLSNAADIQVRAAANRIAADMDYAKGLAITHQQAYAVVFDPAGESYEIRTDRNNDGDYDDADDIVDHPVNPGSFVVDFSATGNLDRVDLAGADFDGDSTKAVTFDYLGSPYHGKSTNPADALLNSGLITLQDKQTGNFKLYVKIEPVTGYVTIGDTP